ncbi:glycosyltransferase [uncultured Erythrobacter sp.]|uniref:glycosyltransferase n=1 Tax=uncultured Erythrobacter sp. TaxID=263913 RepID=UPI00261CA0F8|nr:glycosyltransferase [uncultured Erythrobacter sp.]
MAERKLILHVSGDFPDTIEEAKTKVIRQLVDLTADRLDHHIVSINRTDPPAAQLLSEVVTRVPLRVDADSFEYGTNLIYHAYGRGLFHRRKLHQLGDWLVDHIRQMPRQPDLIIGHKLAFEGIAVRRAAQELEIPYGLSIQGDSDTKVLDLRPDLGTELNAVLQGARVIFPFSPWAWSGVTNKLGVPGGKCVMLPCPTDLDQPLAPSAGGNGLLSVFHLASHDRKNLGGMARAIALLEKSGRSPDLNIIGGGSSAQQAECEAIVRGRPSIRLLGARDRNEVRAAMSAATAFVLPSRRETFGLVFTEALFAGLPVIYPKGTAIDGYFDGHSFALPVNASDPASIADAMQEAIQREDELKAALSDWHHSSHAKQFQRPSIAANFAAGLIHAAG